MVSAIIPCYNNEKTILRALNSVIAQSLSVKEIIIVDDNSTDNSVGVVRQYIAKHSNINIKHIIQQKNYGPSYTRNVGVRYASCKYIAFLDADDSWHSEKLAIQIKVLAENKLNFLGSTYQYDKFSNNIQKSNIVVQKFTFKNLLFKNRFSTPGVIVEREFYLAVGGFDESLKYAEDYDLWLRMALKYDLCTISNPKLVRIYKYAYGISGLSGDIYKMFQAGMLIYRNMYLGNNIGLWFYLYLKCILYLNLGRRYVIATYRKIVPIS